MTAILITGASSGLGHALVRAFAAPGVHFGLLARRDELLQHVADDARARGAQAWTRSVDVTDTDATNTAVRDFFADAGRLDIAIANAGVGEGRRGARFDAEKVAQVMRVNVVGLTNTLLPALELMREQGSGTLVGMASIAGYRAMPGSLAYSTSKAAVMTFMEGLAMELDGTPLRSVTLCPGFVRTPLTDKNDFSMPFLMDADEAADRMKRAILRGQSRYTFPAPMAGLAQVLRVLPRRAVTRVLTRKH